MKRGLGILKKDEEKKEARRQRNIFNELTNVTVNLEF